MFSCIRAPLELRSSSPLPGSISTTGFFTEVVAVDPIAAESVAIESIANESIANDSAIRSDPRNVRPALLTSFSISTLFGCLV